MAVPNYVETVIRLAREYPQEWAEAHRGGPNTEAFAKRVAWTLHQMDSRIGLCGQRGDPNVLGDDSLVYRGEGAQWDPTDGNRPVAVIDFIVGAGGDNPQPGWGTFPNFPHAAAWVKPLPVGDGWVTPKPPAVKPCPDPKAHEPVPPYPDENTFWRAYELAVVGAYAAKGREIDSQSFRWFTRVAYDLVAKRMPPDEAAAAHLAELKRALG
jgi:hypothetical protein